MRIFYFKPVPGNSQTQEVQAEQEVLPQAYHSTAAHLAYAIQEAVKRSKTPLLTNKDKRIQFKACLKSYVGTAKLLAENPLPKDFDFGADNLSYRLAREFFLSHEEMQASVSIMAGAINQAYQDLSPTLPKVKRILTDSYCIFQYNGHNYYFDRLTAERFLKMYLGANKTSNTALIQLGLLSLFIKPKGSMPVPRVTSTEPELEPESETDLPGSRYLWLLKRCAQIFFPEYFYLRSRSGSNDKISRFFERAIIRVVILVLYSDFFDTRKYNPQRTLFDTSLLVYSLYSALSASLSTFLYAQPRLNQPQSPATAPLQGGSSFPFFKAGLQSNGLMNRLFGLYARLGGVSSSVEDEPKTGQQSTVIGKMGGMT